MRCQPVSSDWLGGHQGVSLVPNIKFTTFPRCFAPSPLQGCWRSPWRLHWGKRPHSTSMSWPAALRRCWRICSASQTCTEQDMVMVMGWDEGGSLWPMMWLGLGNDIIAQRLGADVWLLMDLVDRCQSAGVGSVGLRSPIQLWNTI